MPSAVGNVILARIPLSSQLLSTTAVQALHSLSGGVRVILSARCNEGKRNETDRRRGLLGFYYKPFRVFVIIKYLVITPRQRSVLKRVCTFRRKKGFIRLLKVAWRQNEVPTYHLGCNHMQTPSLPFLFDGKKKHKSC